MARNLHQTRLDQQSPQILDVFRLLLKEEAMFHGEALDPVPTLLKCVAAFKFNATFFFFSKSGTIS